MTPTDPALARVGLFGVLLTALALRLWLLATHTYVVWPDETFQYLEPAHRLVFGSGVIAWEFLDGTRSWLLPGIVAGVMWLVSRVDPDPQAYVLMLRLLCVVASLSVPFVGFRLAERRFGATAGILTGLLCALATETVYFAPVVMTEPLATDAALLAIWLGDGAATRRRLLLAGLLFGLACALRYQYAPVLGLVALLQHGRDRRGLGLVAAPAAGVVALAMGVLDTLTWGWPFQTVWLSFDRNVVQGVSAAMGSEPWFYYLSYDLLAWGGLAGVLVAMAAIGALRAPVLAVLVVATIGLHSATPHKELRFVFLASAAMPMLFGIGISVAMRRVRRLRAPALAVPVGVTLALGVAVVTALNTTARAMPADAWHRQRSLLAATAAARAEPAACGLAIRSAWLYHTGGYSYWHRDAPIYFETWDAVRRLRDSTLQLRRASVRDGLPVPQYPGAALAAAAAHYNVMIGAPSDILPGFAQGACVGAGSLDDPTYCVFTRPGGCAG